MKVRRTVVIAAIGLLFLPLSATAQEAIGLRVGVSADPDQFLFGGHLETAPLLERLVFRPSAEIGVGDDLVVIGLNFEFAFKIDLDRQGWSPYVGAGPAINIIIIDRSSDGRGRGADDTNVEGGFNILIGVEHEGGLFTELEVGALDSPDLKFIVGYVF